MVSESRRKERRVHAPAEAAGWPQGQAPDEELMFPGGRVHGHSDRAETGLLGPDEPGKETIQYTITSSRGRQGPGGQHQAVQKPSVYLHCQVILALVVSSYHPGKQ